MGRYVKCMLVLLGLMLLPTLIGWGGPVPVPDSNPDPGGGQLPPGCDPRGDLEPAVDGREKEPCVMMSGGVLCVVRADGSMSCGERMTPIPNCIEAASEESCWVYTEGTGICFWDGVVMGCFLPAPDGIWWQSGGERAAGWWQSGGSVGDTEDLR